MSVKNVALVLFTPSLIHDDRLRKEAIFIQKNASVKVFCLESSGNKKFSGTLFYGLQFEVLKLWTRVIFPSNHFTLLKGFEFTIRLFWRLRKYDIIWIHDLEPSLLVYFFKSKKIILDLHEYPFQFESNFLFKKIIRSIIAKVDIVIHANENRMNLFNKIFGFKSLEKCSVIRNFPDRFFLYSNSIEVFDNDFKIWLNGSQYIYLQGLSNSDRYPFETVDAVLSNRNLKAIVVGSFCSVAYEKLFLKYGKALNDSIYFAGLVNQYSIRNFVVNSLFSIVFYRANNHNNLFCEPNRLFYCFALGKPVIVGNNPTMAALVEKHGNGVSINTDGHDVSDIIFGIKEMINGYSRYSSNSESSKEFYIWENQIHELNKIWYRLI